MFEIFLKNPLMISGLNGRHCIYNLGGVKGTIFFSNLNFENLMCQALESCNIGIILTISATWHLKIDGNKALLDGLLDTPQYTQYYI